jgi:hypothetical protein
MALPLRAFSTVSVRSAAAAAASSSTSSTATNSSAAAAPAAAAAADASAAPTANAPATAAEQESLSAQAAANYAAMAAAPVSGVPAWGVDVDEKGRPKSNRDLYFGRRATSDTEHLVDLRRFNSEMHEVRKRYQKEYTDAKAAHDERLMRNLQNFLVSRGSSLTSGTQAVASRGLSLSCR